MRELNIFARVLPGLTLAFCLSTQVFAEPAQPLPKFDEVYKLLRANLGTVDEHALDRAALQGLLMQLGSDVMLVGRSPDPDAQPALSKTAVFDNAFAYFRISHVQSDLGERFASELERLQAAGKIKGIVLDLRFAKGHDYAAAAALADQFLGSEQTLLDWGEGSVRSRAKTNFVRLPVAAIINAETSGAAEALAAVLRESRVALLVGSPTAGRATTYKEFPVENGHRLRIASARVKVGASSVIPAEGLTPDIRISIAADDERAYLEDPYKLLSQTAGGSVSGTETNRPSRINEAELVRRKREGLRLDEDVTSEAAAAAEVNVVRDPALARSLDLLKGLAVVQQSRR